MSKPNLRLVSPTKVLRTVMPRRRPNSELRPREHLTEREVEKLIAAAKGNRYGARDSTALRCIRICCAMQPPLSWRTRGPIRGRCKHISGIAASNRRCAIPILRRVASRTYGAKGLRLGPALPTCGHRQRAAVVPPRARCLARPGVVSPKKPKAGGGLVRRGWSRA